MVTSIEINTHTHKKYHEYVRKNGSNMNDSVKNNYVIDLVFKMASAIPKHVGS